MIEVIGLSKSFDDVQVLKDINVTFNDNEITCILGESGSGKSVFLQTMAVLHGPDSGKILIDNQDILRKSEEQLLDLRKKIGYLFQSSALYDFMNIFDNLAFPLRENTKLSEPEIEKKIKDILHDVNLSDVEEKFPNELSGGMQKRASLARSVILKPQFLLCDEPTSGLDPEHARIIAQLIAKISKFYKSTTIITSHDIPNSLAIADRLIFIFDGQFTEIGSPSNLTKNTDKRINNFLGPYVEVTKCMTD
ncbi:MAG: ATP-binding cassette domain-containing protein [Candidatus Gygaella obscura]|nr:ATP-binding cassette domain-containing protein [Candidatus Gygaella obscura]